MNHLEIYKLLDKSNCRRCGVPTCMAFALSVINGEKKLEDCPLLDRTVIEKLAGQIIIKDRDKDLNDIIGPLKKEISGIDFSAVAEGLGADLSGGRLRVKCLGKDFYVDNKGNMESVCHINAWVMMPLFKYIITGGKSGLSGKWVSFEELEKGATMARYFNHRCEEPLRQIAGSHIDIFSDMIKIFGGKAVEGFSADYAWIINPLPKVPFLILYSKAEERFESNLKILFDRSADTFLDSHSIYVLGRGIVEMFKRIMSNHEEMLPTLLSL